MDKRFIIIDFDSTFVSVESLDELAAIVLADNPKKLRIQEEIENITKKGMNGQISFQESLEQRMRLFAPTVSHIEQLVILLKQKVTPSIARHRAFFQKFASDIYVISGGFKDFIVPVVSEYGIPEKNVLANTFVYDQHGNIVGYDTANFLAQDKGKIKQLQALHLSGDICVIGDGYTDYEMKESGIASTFYAFCENVDREIVRKKADICVKDFDTFLYHFNP